MKLARLVFATALLLGNMLGTALAQGIFTPEDSCFGVTHFPDDPVDDAPSKFTLGVAIDPMYAGGELTFTLEGPSGTETGTGTVRPDGLAFAYAGLYTYGEHRMSDVELLVAELDRLIVNLEKDFPDGLVFEIDDSEPMCDPSILTPFSTLTTGAPQPPPTTAAPAETSAPAETTAAPPETTAAPAETTAAPVETTAAPDDEGGMFPWPVVLIGGGLLVAAGGAAVAMTGKKNCDQERENLAAAERRLEMINETLEEALNDLAEHESEITSHEADLAAYKKAKAGGSSVDNNVRYFAYGRGRISESDADIQIEYYEGLLRIAREARDKDEARVREWHSKFEKAQTEVRHAEEALALCVGEGSAPAPPTKPQPPETGPTAPGGPTGPAITTPQPKEESSRPECNEGAVYVKPSPQFKTEILRQVVDFAIIVKVMEGTERKVGEAKAMSLGLGEAAAALDLLGKGLGAAGAGESIASGLGGMASGEYVMGTLGLVEGAAGGTMASGLTDVSIPTSPPEAVVEVVKGAAKLGEFVSKKVGEWLGKNQVYEIHLTLFQQTITAKPIERWLCVNGKWTCQTVWEYHVGPLRKQGSTNPSLHRLESDIARHRMNSEVSRLGNRAQSEITNSLTERAKFDAKHQPSTCG